MRYVYFLLLFVLVTSCAHGRLRLKKVDKSDRIEVVESKKKKERSTYAAKHDQKVIETSSAEEEETKALAVISEEKNEQKSISTLDAPETETTGSNDIVADEIEEDPSNKQKLRMAIIAERDARKAKTSFIWSLVMLLMVFIPFVPLFSIIPFIIGTIKLSQSNQSDYITPEGERHARGARIMQLIYAGLLILSLIFIVALLFLIF